jgi:hypothetical protein
MCRFVCPGATTWSTLSWVWWCFAAVRAPVAWVGSTPRPSTPHQKTPVWRKAAHDSSRKPENLSMINKATLEIVWYYIIHHNTTYTILYVCMYVCMYECMHACMHVCMYIYIFFFVLLLVRSCEHVGAERWYLLAIADNDTLKTHGLHAGVPYLAWFNSDQVLWDGNILCLKGGGHQGWTPHRTGSGFSKCNGLRPHAQLPFQEFVGCLKNSLFFWFQDVSSLYCQALEFEFTISVKPIWISVQVEWPNRLFLNSDAWTPWHDHGR